MLFYQDISRTFERSTEPQNHQILHLIYKKKLTLLSQAASVTQTKSFIAKD
jgi:hypothetical protein